MAMNNLAATLYSQHDRVASAEAPGAGAGDSPSSAWRGACDSLWAKSNLARTLYSQGDRARARKLEEQVLETRRRLLGEEHPDTSDGEEELGSDETENLEALAAANVQAEVMPQGCRVGVFRSPSDIAKPDHALHGH
jgi:hypothetical protein